MQIRPLTPADLERLDIDGTIDSPRYLHLQREGEGLATSFKIEDRALRNRLILPNALTDEATFGLKQIAGGIEEGLILVAEHEDAIVGLLVGRPEPQFQTLRIVDLRIDFDFRRQGLATAMTYQAIQHAREQGLRAVAAETLTSNHPANQFLAKVGFDLAGLDTHRASNHDLVKESVTLFWYAALD